MLALRKDMPRIDAADGLTQIILKDEHDKRYKMGMEYRWLNLPVEKTSRNAFTKLNAFSDTYQGISQLKEGRRPEIVKHYFGGRVGQKISVQQLVDSQPRSFNDVLDIVREEGVTTRREYQLAGGDDDEELIGKTRHTLLNPAFIKSHDMDLFEKTLNNTPLFVSFEGNGEAMQIIAEENSLFRRYEADEDGIENLDTHSVTVMCIGRGSCINLDDERDIVHYLVGQNNWPAGTAELIRFSYDSFISGLSFDIGPSS